MAGICLPKKLAELLKKKISSREIDLYKWKELSSGERKAYLESFMDKTSARTVNAVLEDKYTLKNWKQGLVNGVERLIGMSETAKRDILTKVNSMTEILNPEGEASFYKDLVAKRLGLEGEITIDQAKELSRLGQNVAQAKEAMAERRAPLRESTAGEKTYGKAIVEFSDFAQQLKNPDMTFVEFAKMPFTHPGKFAVEVAGVAKSLKASFDNSAIFRQGWKTMMTNPGIWAKNAIKSFADIINVLGGKEVMKEVKADIVSRPTYELMQKEKLAVSTIEEAYPTSLPERIPVFGRMYKASETAFQAFIYRMRADIFDKAVSEAAKVPGTDITGLGRMVNALTGRGHLGGLEPSANVINNIFFSPRLLKSHLDVLSQPFLFKSEKFSPFARKQASMNLIKIIGINAAIITIAKALQPDSVEEDPRSADFGKIKVGNTRFDVSGGMSSVFTLASRMATFSSKSSTTGTVTKLNSGEFGSQTVFDTFINFLTNKLSPVAGVMAELAKGETFSGDKPTIGSELEKAFVPLPFTTFKELQNDPNSAPILAAMILDGLGISTNTYSTNTNWSNNMGVELKQFKEKVGEAKFQEANDTYNKSYKEWFEKTRNDERFKKLDETQKEKIITSKKSELKDKVFKAYRFKYKKPVTKKLPKF